MLSLSYRKMFLRSLTRAAPSNYGAIRAGPVVSLSMLQARSVSNHAISSTALANIEKRWEGMPPQEQAELWMSLRDRMKVDWHQMTLQEKKAAYWIAFGPHGPRARAPKGEGWKISFKVFQLTIISLALFYAIHLFAKPQPKTMSKEWQEASDKYARAEKINPLHGIGRDHRES